MSTTVSPWTWYNPAAAHLSLPGLVTDDLRVVLLASGYVFNAAHEYYDVSITNELPTALGYTSGGQALTAKTIAAGAGPGEWKFLSGNPVWVAAGGSLTARSFALYNNTPATNKPLLGFAPLDFNGGIPRDVTVADTFNLVVLVPATGWFYTQPVDGAG